MGTVVISDYDKGLLTPYFINGIIRVARQHNTPVIVDPKGEGYEKYSGATIVTPNFSEFQTAVKTSSPDEDTIATLGEALRRKLGLRPW